MGYLNHLLVGNYTLCFVKIVPAGLTLSCRRPPGSCVTPEPIYTPTYMVADIVTVSNSRPSSLRQGFLDPTFPKPFACHRTFSTTDVLLLMCPASRHVWWRYAGTFSPGVSNIQGTDSSWHAITQPLWW